jgi:fido (protein-threonine AMPylation protein)
VSNKKSDSFDTDFFLKLHKEMFGDVWDWAGKIRTAELNFGINEGLLLECFEPRKNKFH